MSDIEPVQPKKKNKALIIILVILGVILLLFAGCGLLVNMGLNKASDAVSDLGSALLINPEANSQTGLDDGAYTMTRDSSLVTDGTCGIYGTVTEGAGASVGTAVGLYGEGAVCEGLDSKTSVAFTVSAGKAEIASIS